MLLIIIEILLYSNVVDTIVLPGSCSLGDYYESSEMRCVTCPHNGSLTTSPDGFSCTCIENSVSVGVTRCRPCNVTALVTADGAACVPRRCHSSAGRVACRKCPREYITVTQNLDGSPMKEVQCIKCAKGYRPQDNRCVRCESCACGRHEVVVAGRCIPKKFLVERPMYTENRLPPNVLMGLIKLEYLCTEKDVLACRALGAACVRSLYTADKAGPCSMWLKNNGTKGLPQLAVPFNKNDEEFHLERGKDTIKIVIIEHTASGGIKVVQNSEEGYFKCLPFDIKIGDEVTCNIVKNVTDINSSEYNSTSELYVSYKDDLKPLPIKILKNSIQIQRGTWPTNKFRRFFLVDKYLSTVTNMTEMVYLRTLRFQISISRDVSRTGSLKLTISTEALYETKSPLSSTITTSFQVQHQMPHAGVTRSLEILGGVFCTCTALYALLQWRGAVKRGALHVAMVPLLAGAVADAIYFATLLSTLHALAAEAGSLGLTLPLSKAEDTVISSILYSAVALKALKVLWVNVKQSKSSILLIDWSKYNLSFNEVDSSESDWRTVVVGREWSRLRSRRRVSPGATAALALLVLHFLDLRMSYIPHSLGYKWSIVAISWWSAYSVLLVGRSALDLALGSPTDELAKVCRGVGVSLLVFQEDRYAHYINGRNDVTLECKMITGSLATCRLSCSLQLREIYNKLSTSGYDEFGQDPNRVLTRFMAAFFERALDGLNWVACERTTLERLLDVEFVDREGGNTSVLLYDTDKTPSCFTVTWWGEEWLLATFDAMLFDCVFVSTRQPFLAALITLTVWQVTKHARTFMWDRTLREDWNTDKKSLQMRF